jgi:hypothetical protein
MNKNKLKIKGNETNRALRAFSWSTHTHRQTHTDTHRQAAAY